MPRGHGRPSRGEPLIGEDNAARRPRIVARRPQQDGIAKRCLTLATPLQANRGTGAFQRLAGVPAAGQTGSVRTMSSSAFRAMPA